MKKPRGFSLIELLIVVAIILIIAAIAIPNLLRARIAANEASAVQSVRTVNTASVTYQSQFPNIGYAGALSSLGPPSSAGCATSTPSSASACLLDWVLSNASSSAKAKSGYYFTYTVVAATPSIDYAISGDPQSVGQTGLRGFCSSSDGVIRYKSPGPTGVTTPAGCAGLTALQ